MPTCPNCGTHFPLIEVHDLEAIQYRNNLRIRINNGDVPIERVTGNTLNGSVSHDDLTEVFTANNLNNGENTIMPNTTSTNNTNTGVNTMPINTNNGVNMNTNIDLATLVAMVNDYKTAHQNEVAQAVTDNSTYNPTTQTVTTNVTVDGGKFGKTSKYYGQELCGFMYNPFMVARFLPTQFKCLMNDYEKNVDAGIKATVGLWDSIEFMIDECYRLSYMGDIALAERKHFWSVDNAREIFKDYIGKIQKAIEDAKNEVIKMERYGKRVTYIKLFGKKYDVSFSVKVPEGRPTSYAYTEATIDWKYERVLKSILAELNKCESYSDLYKIMSFRKKELVRLQSAYKKRYIGNGRWETITNNRNNTLNKKFLDGYKKKGAYYTLKDEIMFHNATYKGLTGRDAVALLRKNLEDGTAGYIFYAQLKEILA